MSTTNTNEQVGFVGLGAMGFAMATNLLAAGYPLRVYNRTPHKAQPLVEQGARSADTPGDVATPDGIVISMVADDRALEEVVLGDGGILGRLGPRGIHLAMSTVAPDTARKLAAEHEKRGTHYLAAPVFGRPDAAAARKLWICVSGNAPAKERVRPLLEALGQGIFDFGEDPAAANVVKLAGNFLIASALEAMAEAFTLAEKNGIDRRLVAEMFSKTLFAAPIYQNYGRMIAEKRYVPAGFRLPLGLKDMSLVLQTARGSLVPMPLAAVVHGHLLASVAKGRTDVDWSGLAIEVSEAAGLDS